LSLLTGNTRVTGEGIYSVGEKTKEPVGGGVDKGHRELVQGNADGHTTGRPKLKWKRGK